MKRIRRKMLKIATAPQLGLFEASEAQPARQEAAPREGAVRFNDPDPRQLYLGGRRLDEYLKEAGQTGALKLRQVLREQDWSGFESSYVEEGRRPYAPAGMVGLLVEGLMHGVRSLRGLERRARTDLGSMWLSGGIAPDHASIGRFIVRHEKLLSEEFFEQLTADVLRRLGSGVDEVALDGTVVQAVASAYKTLRREAALAAREQAQAAAAAEPRDEKLAKKLEQATKVAEVAEARAAAREAKGRDAEATRVSPSEPCAVVQPLKHGTFKPAYKPSVAANAARIIVAQALDPSSETVVVNGLIEQANRIGTRVAALYAQPLAVEPPAAEPPAAEPPVAEPAAVHFKVQRAMADAGYFADDVLQTMERHSIDFLCPQGSANGSGDWEKGSEKFYPKTLFVYDEATDRFRCPAGAQLEPFERYAGNAQAKAYVRYRTSACASCPLRQHCTQSTEGRTIKRYPGDKRKDELRARMKLPDIRNAYRRRQAWVEPVFSSLKLNQGLLRFLRRGLQAVRVEFALQAMAHNLGRLLAIAGRTSALQGPLFALLSALLTALRLFWLSCVSLAPGRSMALHPAPHPHSLAA